MRTDPRRLPALDLLVAFDAAARHLSFTKAAAERSLTQSAVSRQIAALEDDLGVPLFHRRHRALELTDEGARMARAAAAALAELREAVQAIRAPRQREVVALTTTPGFASLWLIPRLARFVARHPRIDVRIDASYDTRSLAGEGFDVAVRYGPKDRRTLDAVDTLFAETVQPLCAPALLRGPRPLRRPQDLVHHTLLHITMGDEAPGMPLEWQAWLQTVGMTTFEPAATLTFTNYDTAAAAAAEGQGVLLGRRPLTDGLITGGRLVAPFEGKLVSARGYYLVLDPVATQRPAVEAFVEWLRETARSEAAALAARDAPVGRRVAPARQGTPSANAPTPPKAPTVRKAPKTPAAPAKRRTARAASRPAPARPRPLNVSGR